VISCILFEELLGLLISLIDHYQNKQCRSSASSSRLVASWHGNSKVLITNQRSMYVLMLELPHSEFQVSSWTAPIIRGTRPVQDCQGQAVRYICVSVGSSGDEGFYHFETVRVDESVDRLPGHVYGCIVRCRCRLEVQAIDDVVVRKRRDLLIFSFFLPGHQATGGGADGDLGVESTRPYTRRSPENEQGEPTNDLPSLLHE